MSLGGSSAGQAKGADEQAGQSSSAGGAGGGGGAGKPGWLTKRAQEDAEHAAEKMLDKGFSLKWAGDVADESAMFS